MKRPCLHPLRFDPGRVQLTVAMDLLEKRTEQS